MKLSKWILVFLATAGLSAPVVAHRHTDKDGHRVEERRISETEGDVNKENQEFEEEEAEEPETKPTTQLEGNLLILGSILEDAPTSDKDPKGGGIILNTCQGNPAKLTPLEDMKPADVEACMKIVLTALQNSNTYMLGNDAQQTCNEKCSAEECEENEFVEKACKKTCLKACKGGVVVVTPEEKFKAEQELLEKVLEGAPKFQTSKGEETEDYAAIAACINSKKSTPIDEVTEKQMPGCLQSLNGWISGADEVVGKTPKANCKSECTSSACKEDRALGNGCAELCQNASKSCKQLPN